MNPIKVKQLTNQLAFSNNQFVYMRSMIYNIKGPNAMTLSIRNTLDEIIQIYHELIEMVKEYKDDTVITTKFINDTHIMRVGIGTKVTSMSSKIDYAFHDNETLHNKFLMALQEAEESRKKEIIYFNKLITDGR